MAVAPARRGPDILPVQPIPLSAVTDQPLPGVIAPPVSASAHPDDQAKGVAKEITAEELAAAEISRRGVDPAEASAANEPAKKPDAAPPEKPDDKPAEQVADTHDDGIVVPAGLPGFATREIAKIRKQARERVEAALKTAKGEAGEGEWQKVYEANRDAIVAKANEDVAKAAKTAKEAQDALTAAQAELADLRAKVAAEPKPEETDPKPTRANFDDPDAYDEALAAWGKREGQREADAARKAALEAATKAEETRKAEEQRRAQEAQVLQVQESWAAARTKAIEKYPDYVEVAEAEPKDGGPTITDAMAAAILQVENGTDVAYHFGQNPEESLRIASIPNPVRQFIEIGRIAERLATPRPVVRRARPVEHITDAPNPADTTDAEPDMETYAKQRNAELRQGRQPFFPPGGIH